MSPKVGQGDGKPQGSGPGGRITPDDIRGKVQDLVGGVDDQIQAKRPLLMYAAVGGTAVLLLAVFWLGRRSGRRRSTVVEIRRG